MSFGGDPFGRAFDSGVVNGDSGVMGGVELEAETGPPLDIVNRSAVYGFADYGVLRFRGADRAATEATVGSVGAGYRAVLARGFAVDAHVAAPPGYRPRREERRV